MGINQTKPISELKTGIENKIIDFGFEKDLKKFRPHLTIARIKHISNPNKLKNIINKYKEMLFQKVYVNEVILYESKLKPQGAIYSKLHSFKLKS